MIYQLAKTSVLLSGQVKINLIMNGNTITDIQYTPVSPYISFNYDNPEDVTNYTHLENIKKLYQKIGPDFYNLSGRPELSAKSLYKSEGIYRDTHDNTYEMGMKRLRYSQFNKQFEFFCPVWVEKPDDFAKAHFELCLANRSGKKLYSEIVKMSDKIEDYFDNRFTTYWEKTDIEGYKLDLENKQAYIKGIDAEKGIARVADISYIMDDLLSIDRTVLETDSMLCNVFKNEHMISHNILNLNFVFNIEDFVPASFLKDLILEDINAYVNVYTEPTSTEGSSGYTYISSNKTTAGVRKTSNLIKSEVYDLLSNYDSLPKYNSYKGEYDSKNIYDKTKENTNVNLLGANRLCQHIFHWRSISSNNVFNLSSSFSPYCDDQKSINIPGSDLISNNLPNITSREYSLQDNPLEIFKFTNALDAGTDWYKITSIINNSATYYSINMKLLSTYEAQQFGTMTVDNSKLSRYISEIYKKYEISRFNYFNVGVMLISTSLTVESIRSYYSTEWNVYELNKNGFILFSKPKDNIIETTGKVLFLINNMKESDFLYFKGLIETPLGGDTGGNSGLLIWGEDQGPAEDAKAKYEILKAILKSFRPYVRIRLRGALAPYKADSPDPSSEETMLKKTNRSVDILRVSTNIVPFMINSSDPQTNKVYWGKQYIDQLPVQQDSSDPDDIYTYVSFFSSGYQPVYPSIGFFPLQSSDIDYEKFYMDAWDQDEESKNPKYGYLLERSWYKSNEMLFLPIEFDATRTVKTEDTIDDDLIIGAIREHFKSQKSRFTGPYDLTNVVKYYIKDLYNYTYTYDYISDTDISRQVVKIHFKLK